VDDIIDVIKDEATEDVLRLAGVSREDGVNMSPIDSLRRRLPWLLVNLATAFLAAWVISRFAATIDKVVTLAFFMPSWPAWEATPPHRRWRSSSGALRSVSSPGATRGRP
jgi:Mg/Co/Ni transporter MgtE